MNFTFDLVPSYHPTAREFPPEQVTVGLSSATYVFPRPTLTAVCCVPILLPYRSALFAWILFASFAFSWLFAPPSGFRIHSSNHSQLNCSSLSTILFCFTKRTEAEGHLSVSAEFFSPSSARELLIFSCRFFCQIVWIT